MTSQEAAHSMREAAKRIEAWGNALTVLRPEDLERLSRTFTREARRLRDDAERLEAESQRVAS
jgi:hypothetical protein